MRVELLAGLVRGRGSCRVALRCRDGWVRMEDLREWGIDPAGRVVFQGYADGDPRLSRTLEVGLTPFPEPEPAGEAAPVAATDRREPVLLVALAHPDDETFICGGALAAFTAAGGRVHLVCATRGEHGRRLGVPPSTTREGLPAAREAELRAACRALGIGGLTLLGLRDKCVEFEDDDALAARFALAMRALRADAVLTFHEARGGHPDHCAVGRAATRAWEQAGDPSWHPEHAARGAPAFQPPRLYHLAGSDIAKDPAAHGLRPEQITRVPCSAVARQKLEAFRAHRTQTEMDRDLWEADETRVLARFAAGQEFYQQVNRPFVPGERGLLGLYPGG
jgi:bacillithiol biosynthesis deacetylase BshB2